MRKNKPVDVSNLAYLAHLGLGIYGDHGRR